MADKDKQPELTPWQQEHAEFQKKKQEEAAKLAREEKRKKQPAKVESVTDISVGKHIVINCTVIQIKLNG